MKKTLISILVVALVIVAIGATLMKNKKHNQEKIDIVNSGITAIPVKVHTVSTEALSGDFKANGTLAPAQDLKMSSEIGGRVTSIRVKEGDRVSQGQVIAAIEDKYLAIDIQTAKDALNKLKTDRERYANSLKTGGITQAQYDEIDLQVKNAESRLSQAQKRIGDAFVKAPISGIINKKYIEVGTYLNPGAAMFDIVDVSNLKLLVSVSESQVVRLKKGDKIDITVPVFPDKTFKGVVTFIAAKADNSLNFPVEIRVENNTGNEVKAGMYATAGISFENSKDAIIIPRSAFLGSVSNSEVYVIEGNVAKKRKVIPGEILGETVEILSGLSTGEKVVISGQINLKDGSEASIIQQ